MDLPSHRVKYVIDINYIVIFFTIFAAMVYIKTAQRSKLHVKKK